MDKMDELFNRFPQHGKLPIRLVAPDFGHLSPEEAKGWGSILRSPYYFFLFMLEGAAWHTVDLQQFEIGNNELLFVLPNQVHELPAAGHGVDYFKLGFDESCLSLLPRQYPFLINPLNSPKISFTPAAAGRVRAVFLVLLELLSDSGSRPELILAHLNSLLTEIDTAYFETGKKPADEKLARYIDFRVFVENNLTDHPTISEIAGELAINTNGLYQLVKQYSGLSPKAYITNRLILEAKRRLYYADNPSIKELAFDLGFNDPEYFSRLFKKVTGRTIAGFFQELSGDK
ncbi:MAG: AraC family transcriptional regulator [Candidatus Pseudobacter hemicellulosilyticus]|uniref:AraC family transcriptional regulator n=1 Tax=Candidatus Pseudobacter hemicellulosilyticus TaxID=3121375 RepID=A0AAJ5WSP0_9BACT|nr:MAG: AraC family transcriptional regulator [Pseudobacter sp.]